MDGWKCNFCNEPWFGLYVRDIAPIYFLPWAIADAVGLGGGGHGGYHVLFCPTACEGPHQKQ